MQKNNKKSKKTRGTVLSLNSFLGDTPSGTVVKKITNTDNDCGSEDGSSEHVMLQLPTAPKGNRTFDSESIPHKPPFVARLSNLPFDADEQDIREFFGDYSIVSLRLPREDGDTGRVRGFGNIEFDNRDDLIRALSMPDPNLKGRRIRIERFNENDSQRQMGNRRGFSSFGDSGGDRESTNWRFDNKDSSSDAPSNRYGGGGGGSGGSGRDRDRDRDRESSQWRTDSGKSRNEHSAWRNDKESSSSSSSWRNESRPKSGDFSSWREKADNDNDRERDRGERERDDSTWRKRNDFGPKRYDNNDQQATSKQLPVEERPRLELKPRTLPMPEIVVDKTLSSSSEATDSKNAQKLADDDTNKIDSPSEGEAEEEGCSPTEDSADQN